MRFALITVALAMLASPALAQPAPIPLEQQLDTIQARLSSGAAQLHDTAMQLYQTNLRLNQDLSTRDAAIEALKAERDSLRNQLNEIKAAAPK